MKKSEIYKIAQVAIIDDRSICIAERLEILRELMGAEDLALFSEKQEAQKQEDDF